MDSFSSHSHNLKHGSNCNQEFVFFLHASTHSKHGSLFRLKDKSKERRDGISWHFSQIKATRYVQLNFWTDVYLCI